MRAKLKWAHQAEVLRSDEKDRQHIDSIRRDIFEALSELVGLRHIVRHHQAIVTINSLIYYSLTTLRDRQTLGEQYVNIVRCTSEGRPNSFLQRATLLMDHLPWKQLVLAGSSSRQRVASIIFQLHLIHFYLFGKYSTIARRLGGSRYALLRNFLGMPYLKWSFKIIGVLYTVKLLRELFQSTASLTSSALVFKADPTDDTKKSGTLQCGLCKNPTTDCTITHCGHVFCWTCVTEWVSAKSQCPLCRGIAHPQQLVRVINR